MTGRTERLEIRTIPEACGMPVMFHDVIDFELHLDMVTLRAFVRLLA